VRLEPHLPPTWQRLRFGVRWRTSQLRLELEAATRTVTATLEAGEPLSLRVGATTATLRMDELWPAQWPEPE
jgi:trehalose/maltose hydrolase-like predicted phosphorylase